MSTLKLRIKKQKFIRKENGEKKTGYVGRVVTNGTKDFIEILQASLHGSTIDYRECKAGVEMLLDSIVENIKAGWIIDLGPLGKLYPSVSGKWVEDEEDLSLSDMTGKVNYRPSDDIVGAAKAASLSWATAKDKDKPTTDEEAGDTENTGDDVTGEQGGTTPTTNGENNEP